MVKICVFCSAANYLPSAYEEAAKELGRLIGKNRYALVYGGGKKGLMGYVANEAKSFGSKIIGVIPKIFNDAKDEDELYIMDNVLFRKDKMASISDAFITLPGGLGTLDEISHVIHSISLGIYNKPFIFVNVNGFFDDLLKQLNKIYQQKLANRSNSVYHVSSNVTEAMDLLNKLLESPLKKPS